jgi:hypothetical protein
LLLYGALLSLWVGYNLFVEESSHFAGRWGLAIVTILGSFVVGWQWVRGRPAFGNPDEEFVRDAKWTARLVPESEQPTVTRSEADRPEDRASLPAWSDGAAARVEWLAVAVGMYRDGFARKDVRKKLAESGCPAGELDKTLEGAWRTYVAEQRAAGTQQIGLGGIFVLIGAVGLAVAIFVIDEQPGKVIGLSSISILLGLWNLYRGTIRRIVGG